MAELINLRRARKAKAKSEKDKVAEANRVTHGTPKQLRDLAKARTQRVETNLTNKHLGKDVDQDS